MRRRTCFLRYAAVSLLLGAVFSSCSFSTVKPTPTPDAQGTALAQQLQQTMTALAVTVQAYSAQQTQAALPTHTLASASIILYLRESRSTSRKRPGVNAKACLTARLCL